MREVFLTRKHTVVTPLERRIVDLPTKVIATQDTEEFQAAMAELRDALHQHLLPQGRG